MIDDDVVDNKSLAEYFYIDLTIINQEEINILKSLNYNLFINIYYFYVIINVN